MAAQRIPRRKPKGGRSPEQERLLGQLFVFADRPISLSELANRAGTSLGGAHKEVERLESAGLVRSTTAGRSRLIEADPSSPVYIELRGLLLKTPGPEPLLRSALADVDGIERAFIYGSWTDPDERSPADIDVLVIGEPDVGEVYDAVSDVEAEVGRPVNVTLSPEADGVPTECVVNFDNIHTLPRNSFRRPVTKLSAERIAESCRVLRDATGC